jgi:hypothetical protein
MIEEEAQGKNFEFNVITNTAARTSNPAQLKHYALQHMFTVK